VEVGQGHYRVMAAFHTLLLVACVAEPWLLARSFSPSLATMCIAVLVGAQALRWWAITSLGPRWTTRVIVLTDAEPVTGGPYRWLRHPNYVAVMLEMIALPLVGGAWMTAVLASLGNALLLRARIATEERALGAQWARTFAATPRFVPGGRSAGA
jgi:methyltransferase